MKMYKLERRVDGRWYEWGMYSETSDLVWEAAKLGKLGYNEFTIRVSEVEA